MEMTERLRSLAFESYPIPVLIIDPETLRNIDFNQAATKAFGLDSREATLQTTLLDISAPGQYDGSSSREKIHDYIREAIQNGHVNFDWKHQNPDGKIWDAEVCVHTFLLDNRQLLQCTFLDVTARKHKEQELHLNESKFRKFFELPLIGFVVATLEKSFVEVNDRFCELLGYDRQELSAMTWADLTYFEDRAEEELRYKKFLAREIDSYTMVKRFVRKDGTLVHVVLSGTCLRNPDHSISFLVAAVQDISEIKRMESLMSENSEIFSLFMQHSPIMAYVKEITADECVVLQASDSFVSLIGRGGQDIVGKNMHELFPADFAAKIIADDHAVVAAKKILRIEETFDNRFFTTIKFPIAIGKRILLAGYTIEITDRVMMEKALRENEEKKIEQEQIKEAYNRLSTVMDSMDSLVYIADMQTYELLFVNSLGIKIFGNIIGQACWKTIQKGQTGPCPFCPNSRLIDKDGNPTGVYQYEFLNTINNRWYDCRDMAIKWIDGRIVRMEVATDITANKQAEAALREIEVLRESEKKVRKALEFLPVPIALADKTGRITFHNRRFVETYGYTVEDIATVEKWIELAFPDEEYRHQVARALGNAVESALNNDSFIPPMEFMVTCKNGDVKTVEISAYYEKDISIGLFIDTSERKRLEAALRNVQKLESLGILAGGIAHDFNNLLGGIFGFIDLARIYSRDDQVTSCLDKAIGTMERARSLTQQLLTFAKGGVPVQKVAGLFPFIQETVQFALSGSNVSAGFDIEEGLWLCNYDRNQIGQVFDNLVINAQQAMPLGGAIELTARNTSLPEGKHPLLANGDYIRISVKDSGAGIPREMISKVFDPFFTTKSKGHGLGLTTCYSIISRHGGCIEVESEPGHGSVFHVYLPASHEAAADEPQLSAKSHHGAGRILLMDDEETIRETVGGMLEHLGYFVVSKDNGCDAVEFFQAEKQAGEKFAGLIFDLTIPGSMGGIEAVAAIRQLDPDVPVFVSSGYANDPVMKNPVAYGFTASICKPFRLKDLSELLERHVKTRK